MGFQSTPKVPIHDVNSLGPNLFDGPRFPGGGTKFSRTRLKVSKTCNDGVSCEPDS